MEFQYLLVACLVLTAVANAQDKITGVVGKDVQLSCDLPRTNPPQIKWKDWVHNTGRDAQTIFDGTTATDKMVDASHPNKDNLMINDDFSLTIKKLNLNSDAGEYFCISIQGDGSEAEKTFQVDIGALPECSGDTKLSEGETSLLTCQALFSGNTVPQLEWFMGDKQLQSIDMNDIGVAKRDYTIAGATHEQDAQTFTCKMVLGMFTEECSLAATVTYMVRDVKIMPESDKITVSDEIKCSAKGNPKPVIDLKVTTEGDAMVNIMEGSDYKSFVVDKELEGQKVTVSCTASNNINGKEEEMNKKMTYTVVAPPTTTTPKTTTTMEIKIVPTEKVQPNKGDKEPVTPKPDNTGPEPKEAGNVVGIVAGVIIAALVIVVIVIAVVCIRRKSTKKNKGTKVPTKEEEARRLEDGRGGRSVAYSEGEKHGRYRRTNTPGAPSNGGMPYGGVVYHKPPGDRRSVDVDMIGSVDLDNNNPPPSRVDFTENDYTQILHPNTIDRVHN